MFSVGGLGGLFAGIEPDPISVPEAVELASPAKIWMAAVLMLVRFDLTISN